MKKRYIVCALIVLMGICVLAGLCFCPNGSLTVINKQNNACEVVFECPSGKVLKTVLPIRGIVLIKLPRNTGEGSLRVTVGNGETHEFEYVTAYLGTDFCVTISESGQPELFNVRWGKTIRWW